ncbi:GTP-binding protein rho4 [Intoshia linei]|uniref:GTP-binding protein rho4 n=1 Tax=Intoshia linei TaxID=1819745 RepID=A0A177B656_9BILA|nr:GTP-binding protein rho4 [Intoshia linei]
MESETFIHKSKDKTIISKKLVVVGDGSIGKTCLLISYAKNEFPDEYIPTVFEIHVTLIEMDTCSIRFALWDTAGQEEYDSLRPLSYPNSDVILTVFSVAEMASYHNIRDRWWNEIKHYCPLSQTILVATKIDLRDDSKLLKDLEDRNNTILLRKDTLLMATKLKFDAWHECSAKTKVGLNELFSKAAKLSLEQKHSGKKKCVIL